MSKPEEGARPSGGVLRIYYPCACSATGENLPDYCPEHGTPTREALLMRALVAADRFGREVTSRVLLPPDGRCVACGEQVPPAVHHPGCWLRPLLTEVRETFSAAGVPVAPAVRPDPLRTRPDYNLRCDRCGAPHNLDTSIPSEMWNAIMPNGGALCTLCIDDLLAEKGLTATAEFYFVGRALKSRLYES